MNNVTLNHVACSDYVIYRGHVTLVDAQNSNADQNMLNNLMGLIKVSDTEFRPFSDNALFTFYSAMTNYPTINGHTMNYMAASTKYPLVTVEGHDGSISLLNKCWYICTDLPD